MQETELLCLLFSLLLHYKDFESVSCILTADVPLINKIAHFNTDNLTMLHVDQVISGDSDLNLIG